METETIKTDFLQVLSEVFSGVRGITLEQAITATSAIMQEAGKYARQEVAIQAKSISESSTSTAATEKQKIALSKFGVKFSDDITKSEASEMLDKLITESRNKKGR